MKIVSLTRVKEKVDVVNHKITHFPIRPINEDYQILHLHDISIS